MTNTLLILKNKLSDNLSVLYRTSIRNGEEVFDEVFYKAKLLAEFQKYLLDAFIGSWLSYPELDITIDDVDDNETLFEYELRNFIKDFKETSNLDIISIIPIDLDGTVGVVVDDAQFQNEKIKWHKLR